MERLSMATLEPLQLTVEVDIKAPSYLNLGGVLIDGDAIDEIVMHRRRSGLPHWAVMEVRFKDGRRLEFFGEWQGEATGEAINRWAWERRAGVEGGPGYFGA